MHAIATKESDPEMIESKSQGRKRSHTSSESAIGCKILQTTEILHASTGVVNEMI